MKSFPPFLWNTTKNNFCFRDWCLFFEDRVNRDYLTKYVPLGFTVCSFSLSPRETNELSKWQVVLFVFNGSNYVEVFLFSTYFRISVRAIEMLRVWPKNYVFKYRQVFIGYHLESICFIYFIRKLWFNPLWRVNNILKSSCTINFKH